jgi:hypothetical protein
MVGLYILVWDGINPLFYNFVYYSMFLCVPCLLLKHVNDYSTILVYQCGLTDEFSGKN